MPFSGFKDFAECVLKQKKKGHPDDVAKKICGKLQSKEENNLNKFSVFCRIDLKKESKESTFEVLRVGTLQDRGMKITQKMLEQYVQNFIDNGYNGSEISVNMNHKVGTEAAGWIKNLFIEKTKLMMSVEWTSLGKEYLEKKLYKFISVELWSQIKHWKTGKVVDNVLSGAALTNDPGLGGQTPIPLNRIKFLSYNKPNMEIFKMLLEKLANKKAVNKEEKTLLKKAFMTLEDEQKEEVKEEMKEVEEKPEQTEEEKKAEEDKKTEEDKDDEEKKKEELKRTALESRLANLEKENNKLKVDSKKIKLEKIASELMLNEKTGKGFAGENTKEEVVELMMDMSDEQIVKFVKLQAKSRTVEVAPAGKTGTNEPNNSEKTLLEKAEKYMAEHKCDYREALEKVTPEGFSV